MSFASVVHNVGLSEESVFFIPLSSLNCTGWRAGKCNSRKREGWKSTAERSGAIMLAARRAKFQPSKNLASEIWQHWHTFVLIMGWMMIFTFNEVWYAWPRYCFLNKRSNLLRQLNKRFLSLFAVPFQWMRMPKTLDFSEVFLNRCFRNRDSIFWESSPFSHQTENTLEQVVSLNNCV